MRATVLHGRWSGEEVTPLPEESGVHRAMSRGGTPSPWMNPGLWLQLIVLVGGMFAMYWADKGSDRQQLAVVTAVATRIEVQVASIERSVDDLTRSQTGLQKDGEAMRRDIEALKTALKDQKDLMDAWIQTSNKAIARLEARAGIN